MLTKCHRKVTDIAMSVRCSGLLKVGYKSTIGHDIRQQRSFARTFHTSTRKRELHCNSARSGDEEVDVTLLQNAQIGACPDKATSISTTHQQDTSSVQYCPTSPPPASYHIPPATLGQAIATKQHWQWNLFRHVETNQRPTRHYCKTKAQAEEVAQLFLQDGYEHLGFDLEWDPKAPKHADLGMKAKSDCSMLQLANEKR